MHGTNVKKNTSIWFLRKRLMIIIVNIISCVLLFAYRLFCSCFYVPQQEHCMFYVVADMILKQDMNSINTYGKCFFSSKQSIHVYCCEFSSWDMTCTYLLGVVTVFSQECYVRTKFQMSLCLVFVIPCMVVGFIIKHIFVRQAPHILRITGLGTYWVMKYRNNRKIGYFKT